MINPYSVVVDAVHITDLYEAYVTYADDEYLDIHDYDDDTDDDSDHKDNNYTAAGAAPGPHGSPGGTFYPEGQNSKRQEVPS